MRKIKRIHLPTRWAPKDMVIKGGGIFIGCAALLIGYLIYLNFFKGQEEAGIVKRIPLPTRWAPKDMVLKGGRIFVGCTAFYFSLQRNDESEIICLDKKGQMLWVTRIPIGLWHMLLARGIIVCFGMSRRSGIFAIDERKGDILWKTPLTEGMRIANGTVIRNALVCRRLPYEVEGRDLRTGRILWKRKMRSYFPFIGKLGDMCLLGEEAMVYCVNPLTGAVIWEKRHKLLGNRCFNEGVLASRGEISLWSPRGLVRRKRVKSLRIPFDVCRFRGMIFVTDLDERVWAFTEDLSLRWVRDLREELGPFEMVFPHIEICGERLVIYGLAKKEEEYRTLAIILLEMKRGKTCEKLFVERVHFESGLFRGYPLACEDGIIYAARYEELGEVLELRLCQR